MCLAVPGRIIRIEGKIATIDYGMQTRKREAQLLEPKGFRVGDYVIVQQKIVVQKIPCKEALKSIKAWKKVISSQY
jgi:hydrogenase expression/formation protein HypC